MDHHPSLAAYAAGLVTATVPFVMAFNNMFTMKTNRKKNTPAGNGKHLKIDGVVFRDSGKGYKTVELASKHRNDDGDPFDRVTDNVPRLAEKRVSPGLVKAELSINMPEITDTRTKALAYAMAALCQMNSPHYTTVRRILAGEIDPLDS